MVPRIWRTAFVLGYVVLVLAAALVFGGTALTAVVAILGIIVGGLNTVFGHARGSGTPPVQAHAIKLLRVNSYTRGATVAMWVCAAAILIHGAGLSPWSPVEVRIFVEQPDGSPAVGFPLVLDGPLRTWRVVTSGSGTGTLRVQRRDIARGLDVTWRFEGVRDRRTISSREAASEILISLPPVTTPFRVSYHRLVGIATAMAVQGHVAPEWEDMFPRTPLIAVNGVLAGVKEFLDRFGEPLRGYHLTGSPGHEYRETADMLPVTRAYLGGDNGTVTLPIPDPEAAATMFETSSWPVGYEITCSDFSTSPTDAPPGRTAPPTLWRYLRTDDLKDYVARARQSFGYPGDFHLVESLRYLTGDSIPPGFMVVYGREQAHYGWLFETELRVLEMFVMVVENTSSEPLQVTSFLAAEIDAGLRSDTATPRMLDGVAPTRQVFPGQQLRPGDQVIVPLRMQLGMHTHSDYLADAAARGQGEYSWREGMRQLTTYRRQFVAECYDGWREWAREQHTRQGSTAFHHRHSDELLFQKEGTPPEVSTPDLASRFDFGLALLPVSLEIGGVEYPVTQFDPSNIALFAGLDVGSCPHVYSYDSERRRWIYEAVVMPGAVGHAQKGNYMVRLRRFDGVLQVRQLESELSLIDMVAIHAVLSDGTYHVIPPADERLVAVDDLRLELHRGEVLEIRFESSIDWTAAKSIHLELNGYYLPYGSNEFRWSHLKNGPEGL